MMNKYLKQLTQISILNFFFILGLLFFVQKQTLMSPSREIKSTIRVSATPSPIAIPSREIGMSQATPAPTIAAVKKDLFAELSTHNTKSNCWLAVSGHIYDVTTYFGSHPGGDGPIQKYCGQDATTAFQSKDGIGADHSASAYDLLHQYLIQ